ncbi:MAG: nucleotidyltransferase domain-containing protein [Candidatus Omnitrophota bacterium]
MNRKGRPILSINDPLLKDLLNTQQKKIAKAVSVLQDSDGIFIYLGGSFSIGALTAGSDMDVILEPATRIKNPREYPSELKEHLCQIEKRIREVSIKGIDMIFRSPFEPYVRIDPFRLRQEPDYLYDLYRGIWQNVHAGEEQRWPEKNGVGFHNSLKLRRV